MVVARDACSAFARPPSKACQAASSSLATPRRRRARSGPCSTASCTATAASPHCRSRSVTTPPAQPAGLRADAKTDAREEFHPVELVLESEPLCHGKLPPRCTRQLLAGPVEPQPATVKYQEAFESALVESPVPYRPGIDVDKTRLRIPADTAALHRPGFGHRIGKLRFEADVERAAHDMLAMLGDAKGRPGEQRIRLGRAIG